jgi:hypothetical protein
MPKSRQPINSEPSLSQLLITLIATLQRTPKPKGRFCLFMCPGQITGNPEAIGSSVGFVPINALRCLQATGVTAICRFEGRSCPNGTIGNAGLVG